MRIWMMPVGILVVAGIMGCGTRPVDTADSEAVRQRDEPEDSSPPAVQAEQDRDQETIERWLTGVTRNREEALEAWKVMYEEQKSRNGWRWTNRANEWPNNLSKEFREWINTHPGDAEIPPALREEYQIAIREHVSQLGQIIGQRHTTADKNTGIVEWNDGDFVRVARGVYWITCPLTVQIRLAQEDLWACEAILQAIAKTNEEAGATNYDNAAIKRIETLEVAQPAAGSMFMANRGKSKWSFGEFEEYDEECDSENVADQQSGEGEGHAPSKYEPSIPVGPPSEERMAERLRTGRYVDLDGEPQAADTQPYAEFNLLPVHVHVVMDQKKLPNLLVYLANSHMPVEVKHLRIDGVKQDVASLGSDQAVAAGEDDRDGVPVEIVGMMRIFNPPPPTR